MTISGATVSPNSHRYARSDTGTSVTSILLPCTSQYSIRQTLKSFSNCITSTHTEDNQSALLHRRNYYINLLTDNTILYLLTEFFVSGKRGHFRCHREIHLPLRIEGPQKLTMKHPICRLFLSKNTDLDSNCNGRNQCNRNRHIFMDCDSDPDQACSRSDGT